MTKENNPEEVDETLRHEDSTASPGALLQRAREAKSLSLESVANVLRISRAKMQALEADRYDEMPAEAFVRGYIRAYCKLVDLDEVELVALYDECYTAQREVNQLVQPQEIAPINWLAPVLMRFWYVPVVLIVLVVVWVFLKPEQKAPQINEVRPAAVQQLAPEKSERLDDKPDQIVSVPESAVSDSDSQSMPVEEAAPAAVATREPVSEAANSMPAMASDILRLQFNDECWLEVSDAKGDVLAADLKQAGDSVELRGTAPFNVMLGNARAAKVNLNGREVETAPNGINRALRLQVK